MILVVLFAGFILRIISLSQSLWLDETTSALVARMSWGDVFTKFLPNDFHPPLYYLVLKIWVNVFGSSEISVRFPSIIFGILTIYFIYLIGKKIFNQKVGLITALLLATSGLHIYYSQEARMYSLATFLVTLSVYLFLNKKWLIFSVVIALIGMTDYVSLFIIPVFFIADIKNWKKLLITLIPIILTFVLWLPIFIKQLFSGLSVQGTNWWNILGAPTLKNIVLIPIKFTLGRIGFDNVILYTIVVFIVFLIFGYLLYKTINKSKFVWMWLLIPILLIILISFKIPSLSYFRLLFCLPAFYLLVASGIKNRVFLVLVLIVNISSSALYLFDSRFHREDWRSAAVAIRSEKIVFPSDSQKEALTYYGKGDQIIAISDLNQNDRQLWLSRYVWEIFDPSDTTRKKLESLGYNKISENNFNGVVFWKYSK